MTRVEAGKKELIQEKLRTLISVFVLQQTVDLLGPRGEGSPVAAQGRDASPSAMEEMQLLLALQKKVEDQKDASLRYALFDAVFGRIEQVELVKGISRWVGKGWAGGWGTLYWYFACERSAYWHVTIDCCQCGCW